MKDPEFNEEMTETQVLLKILELASREIAEGKGHPVEKVFERLRKRRAQGSGSAGTGRGQSGDAESP